MKVRLTRHAQDRILERVHGRLLPFDRYSQTESWIVQQCIEAMDRQGWTRQAPKWAKFPRRIPRGVDVRYLKLDAEGGPICVVASRSSTGCKIITVVVKEDE